MNKVLIALVCAAMVFLGVLPAFAATWDCHVEGTKRSNALAAFVDANLDIVVDDSKLSPSTDGSRPELAYAVKQWQAAHPVGVLGQSMIFWDRTRCTPRILPRHAPSWQCRVASRWVAVFGPLEKPQVGRGLEAFEGTSSQRDKSAALQDVVGQHAARLKSYALKNGRSVTITLAAGDCWQGAKPAAPVGWPSNLPWASP